VELRDRLNRRAIDDDVNLVGPKLMRRARSVIEDAIAFGGEAGADVAEDWSARRRPWYRRVRDQGGL